MHSAGAYCYLFICWIAFVKAKSCFESVCDWNSLNGEAVSWEGSQQVINEGAVQFAVRLCVLWKSSDWAAPAAEVSPKGCHQVSRGGCAAPGAPGAGAGAAQVRAELLPGRNVLSRAAHGSVCSQHCPSHPAGCAGLTGEPQCNGAALCFQLDTALSSSKVQRVLCTKSMLPSLHFWPHLMATTAEIAGREMGKQMTQQLYFKTKTILDPPGLISWCYFSVLSENPCVMQSGDVPSQHNWPFLCHYTGNPSDCSIKLCLMPFQWQQNYVFKSFFIFLIRNRYS